jgi:hypothetical protein
MAVVMDMRWDGVTPDQYDRTRDLVRWETEAPAGAIFHVSWFEDGGLRVIDVWESADAFNTFVETRLRAGTAEVGIDGEPAVTFHDAHRVFDAAHGDARS